MFPRIPDEKDAIGGYFSLEPGSHPKVAFHPDVTPFQSARAAFLALLEARRPARVHVPWYLCDSMLEPLRQCGIEARRYRLTDDFRIADSIDPTPSEWVVYVNYFGLCGRQVAELIGRLPPGQVVVDNSQAFFADASDCFASIYSARKFFGVPDGGYLRCPGVALNEYPRDTDSILRMTHLTKRLTFGAEAGYADYAAAEKTLCNQPARRMSVLTEQLLAGVDYAEVRRRRVRNYELLRRHLDVHNELRWPADAAAVPLCYPFLPRLAGLREALIAARVYVPRYWPDLLEAGADMPAREYRLATDLLPLPIDQRCEPETLLQYIVEPILSALRP